MPLITFEGWHIPQKNHIQFAPSPKPEFIAPKYNILCHASCKEEKINTNVVYWVWLQEMHYVVKKVLHLIEEVINKFKYVIIFKVSAYHIYV